MTREEFTNWVHKFGMISSAILMILMFAFPIIASMVYGVWPSLKLLWPAMVVMIVQNIPFWFAETIGYMTVMGPGALYLSYITGNVTNLRMPATIGTINALGVEPNTDECHTLAIIACGASNLTTVGLVLVGLFLAVPLQPVLTAEALQPALNYCLPALFGGIVAQSVITNKKDFGLYLIPLALYLFFHYCTSIDMVYYMLICIAIGVVVFYLFDYKMIKDK